MNCRHCKTFLKHTFLDLGFAPLSNAYLSKEDLNRPEIYFPLKIKVCDQCWLAQTEDYAQVDELFSHDYAYFSSTSSSWLNHARQYAEKMITELGLNNQSFVIEVASNDGYLLRNFLATGIPCLGIEPTDSTATAAEQLGISVMRKFFGEALGKQLAKKGQQADLIVGNNVFAHVPDINDFTHGLKAALKPGGTITLEFPHLMSLIEQAQFDTVYHEHFSYLSLYTVCRIFSTAGLRIFNVEELSTHGGSLRVYGSHQDDPRLMHAAVSSILQKEIQHGLQDLNTYLSFQPRADMIKDDLLFFLIEQKRLGKKVVAYGAAAKGNTLLNYAGIKPDLIEFVCDAAKAKQGKFMPGSHIPILHTSEMLTRSFDYVLILPWNIASEVVQQNSLLKTKGVCFVTAVPELVVL
jgi:2-polyprenyl-3-methyl-5-hydroxy-6-metoxy-1,4-benzoquinol methylase